MGTLGYNHKHKSKKQRLEWHLMLSREIYGEKYTYDILAEDYGDQNTKIRIICPIHGEFFKSFGDHIHGKQGCKICSKSRQTQNARSTTEEFVRRATNIHQGIYDYFKVKYVNMCTKVEIICSRHGSFFQEPSNHLWEQQGCPNCKLSKGELAVRRYLDEHSIQYVQQKRFKNCNRQHTLVFDFFLPNCNIAIEYDGEHHYVPTRYGGMSQLIAEQELVKSQQRDTIKNQYCKNNNIQLIRIPYFRYREINTILEKIL